MNGSGEALPDVIRPGLDLVICGTASGKHSAAEQAYYAQPNNRFWHILEQTGLTPRRLDPDEYKRLPDFGIGLTDLAKRYSGIDSGLRPDDFDIAGFRQKIEMTKPRFLVFNGKKAASIYFGVHTRNIDYGCQNALIGETAIIVVTQTSGANAHWKAETWHECARFVRETRSGLDRNKPEIERINNYLQSCLREFGRAEVSAVEAAKWLDRADLLKDSPTRPGKPLRDLLRAEKILGQEQRPNRKCGNWWITRVD